MRPPPYQAPAPPVLQKAPPMNGAAVNGYPPAPRPEGT